MEKPRLSFRDEETITNRKRSSHATSEKNFRWGKKCRRTNDCFGINATFLWERLTTGYRIVDLQELEFENALVIIQNHYFPNEPVCRANMLSEHPLSVTAYSQYIWDILLQEDSICAVQEGTGELVGIAVVSVCNKIIDESDDPFDTKDNDEDQDEIFGKIMQQDQNLISNADIYKKFETDKYCRVNVLCVRPSHQNKGIGTALVRSCFMKSWVLQIHVCVGIFSSGSSLTIANRLGFQILQEINFKGLKLSDSKIISFESMDILPSKEKTATCMGIEVPLIQSLPLPLAYAPSKIIQTRKQTRAH